MRKRSALSSVVIASFLVISLFQVTTFAANAEHSPLTSPVTSPLTSFIFKIGGKITIKHFKWKLLFSRFLPAEDITVKLENVKTHDTMTTQTDEDGMYIFSVNDKGWYKVSPKVSHDIADITSPPFRFVKLNKHDMLHENFQLLDLP